MASPGISGSSLYELALLSARHIAQCDRSGRVVLVTPETAPLELFGAGASDAVAALLEDAGIEVHCGRQVAEVVDGGLRLVPDTVLEIDRVVTVPRLRGPHSQAFLPEDGFIPTDAHGLVDGTEDVYAAGDATAFRSSTEGSPSIRRRPLQRPSQRGSARR